VLESNILTKIFTLFHNQFVLWQLIVICSISDKGGNLDFLEDKTNESDKKKNKKLSQFQKFEQQKKQKLGNKGPK